MMDSRQEGEGAAEKGSAKQGGASVGHPINVATGAMFADCEDIRIAGRVPLVWPRHYSTDLLAMPTPYQPFGQGWYCAWFVTLTRVDKEFRFRTPQGSVILLPDPDGQAEKGKTIRDLGTFTEIRGQGMYFRVTQWDPESYKVATYVFLSGRNGQEWPLRFLENGTGDGVELAWDDQGRLKGLRQKLEKRTLAVAYTAENRVESVAFRHADGRQEILSRYEYDKAGRLAAAYDALDLADRYDYDRAGRLVRESDKDGGVFTFKYDDKGRCVRTSGLDNYDLKLLRYMDHIGTTQVTNSYGKVWLYKWLPTGQIIEEISPLGGIRKTGYDEFGRIIGVLDAAGLEVRYGFDESGNRASIKYPGGEKKTAFDPDHRPLSQVTKDGAEYHREYEASGRIKRTKDPVGVEWEFCYDADGNLIKVDMGGIEVHWAFGPNGAVLEGRGADGHITRYVYDAYGRLERKTGPMGDIHAYRSDALGRIVEGLRPDGSRTFLAYDAGGNVISAKDGNGLGMRYLYGPCGRLLAITDAIGRTTRLRWGTEPGRLEAIENAKGEVQRFFHDAEGNVVREVDFAGVEKRFVLDVAGRAIAMFNGMGERIACERDEVGRLSGLILPDGSKVEYVFGDSGALVKASCPDAVVEVESDILGRTLKETRGDAWIKYAYSRQGKVARMETSLGLALDYDYDVGNLLAAVRSGEDTLVGIRRNPLGAEIGRTLPGGLFQEQEVDPVGRLHSQGVFANAGGAPVVSRKYAWNGMVLAGVRDAAWGETHYAYDGAEQLIRAHQPGKAERLFEYDATGNLTLERYGVNLEDCLIGTGNRLLRRGSTRFEYDRAGRLIRKIEASPDPDSPGDRVWEFAWDALDQLRALTRPDGAVWRYRYDPMGRRIAKEGPEGTMLFHWDRHAVVHDDSGGGNSRAWIMDRHTYKPFGRLQKGVFCPIVTDLLGTPREMLDPMGIPIWTAQYGPFGDLEAETHPENRCPLRFQGQWLDEESGLHYNRYRYYDPSMSRYVSPDLVGLRGGMNVYRYTPNPINWIDPLGLDWNYVLVDPAGKVYYTGQAGDGVSPCAVMNRHAGNPKDGDAPQRFNPHPDPAVGDQMFVVATGLDHETSRGLEQRISDDHDLMIGRRDSDQNEHGSVRGNNQNPVDQNDSNPKRDSRADAAQDHLDKTGKSTDDLIADAMKKGPAEKCK